MSDSSTSDSQDLSFLLDDFTPAGRVQVAPHPNYDNTSRDFSDTTYEKDSSRFDHF